MRAEASTEPRRSGQRLQPKGRHAIRSCRTASPAGGLEPCRFARSRLRAVGPYLNSGLGRARHGGSGISGERRRETARRRHDQGRPRRRAVVTIVWDAGERRGDSNLIRGAFRKTRARASTEGRGPRGPGNAGRDRLQTRGAKSDSNARPRPITGAASREPFGSGPGLQEPVVDRRVEQRRRPQADEEAAQLLAARKQRQ